MWGRGWGGGEGVWVYHMCVFGVHDLEYSRGDHTHIPSCCQGHNGGHS